MPSSSFLYDGVNYTFPTYKASGNDNVVSIGQTVKMKKGKYFSVQLLAASETGVATGFINATYSDGSTTSGPVLVDPWWDWPYPYGGDIIFPYYYSNTSIDYNRSMIFQTINWIDSAKELVSLQLPNVTAGANTGPGGASIDTRLHVFSLSLWPASNASTNSVELKVQYARSTQLWLPETNKTQIVEAVVNNVGEIWVTEKSPVQVTVESNGYSTVQPAVLKRLRPGDQAKVQIGVVTSNCVSTGSAGEATVRLSGGSVNETYSFNATFGIKDYEATYESVYAHESPSWYNDAKYGIFIHWGVYSVPGWGNVGKNESYAEWCALSVSAPYVPYFILTFSLGTGGI